MTNKFTQAVQNALNHAGEVASEMGHTYIGTEHLLCGLISESDAVAGKLLESKGITEDDIRERIEKLYGRGETQTSLSGSDLTPRTKKILSMSVNEAMALGYNYVGTEHVLMAMLREGDSVAVRILGECGINARELYSEAASYVRGENAPEEDENEDGVLESTSPSEKGDNKIKGAPVLSQYGRCLTDYAREGKLDPIIGRDNEMQRVIQILSRRTKNNPCLIGEPGVGKTAVIEGLAQMISDGNVPENLCGKRLVTLDLAGMLAGAKYRGEFEDRFKKVMKEISKNKDIILFIDEIHMLVGAGAAEGAIDAANIVKPALARGEMQLIGATTIDEYRKHIEKDAALERRFQSVTVSEPTCEESVLILKGLRDKYEAHHKLKITDEAIEAAVSYSSRYISDRFLPDKAIDLVDEAASRVRINAFSSPDSLKELEKEIEKLKAEKEEAIRSQDFEKAAHLRDEEKQKKSEHDRKKDEWKSETNSAGLKIDAHDIAEIVTQWTKIPVAKLEQSETEKLLTLGKILHERIVGQDEAVDAVVKAIRRSRTGLKDPHRPVGSFIFLGPTGVGKTELCKTLASVLFGTDDSLIRVDMSEYMEKHSVAKLIGSPPGYVGDDDAGQLTEKIRRHPYCVLLFDEIEKAHPDVFNILLQVLDDGQLTDAHGRKVDFKNTIIIMTSNVGASGITESKHLGFGETSVRAAGDYTAMKSDIMAELKRTFKPEFLNRLDEIIIFGKLSREQIETIAGKLLSGVTERISGMGISVKFDKTAVALCAEQGFDPIYGARPLKRAIQHLVEDTFSLEMLEGRIASGDNVTARAENGTVIFSKDSSETEKKASAENEVNDVSEQSADQKKDQK